MATESDSTNSSPAQQKQFFVYRPQEDGRPIVEDGKAVAYVEEDAPPLSRAVGEE